MSSSSIHVLNFPGPDDLRNPVLAGSRPATMSGSLTSLSGYGAGRAMVEAVRNVSRAVPDRDVPEGAQPDDGQERGRGVTCRTESHVDRTSLGYAEAPNRVSACQGLSSAGGRYWV